MLSKILQKENRRTLITALYCIIFYGLMLYKIANGLLLMQVNPVFFCSREDIFTWAFMQSGLHQCLLNSPSKCVLMDALFYSSPAIYILHYFGHRSTAFFSGIWMLLINWLYVQCYTLYPTNSIEGHTAWLLFPILFMVRKESTFNLLFEGLRYFFLYFFASAGLWKVRHGSVFLPSEMSGILLGQHIQLLTNSPDYWQSKFILWLINNAWVSYSLYVSATAIELFFMVGFFTKKLDKLLILLFVVFLITDHLIMRIPYYEVMPFLITLFPGTSNEKNRL